jgi:AraC family transcriptional regulator of adaptative response / DNA-3-methyladenine glycosylase II
MIDGSDLPMSEVALGAGFRSIRQFNHAIHRTFGRSPRELRRLRRSLPHEASLVVRLAYRPPFDWRTLVDFLRRRATPGVESVEGETYRRTFASDGFPGTLAVSPVAGENRVELRVEMSSVADLMRIVERVKRIFDLNADPGTIEATLSGDPRLRRFVRARPGLRVPGAWDGFELAVRAILGQQVSVRAATTIAGRIAATFGSPIAEAGSLSRLFPTPAQLATVPIERAGVMPARAETIRALARSVMNGAIDLSWSADSRAAVAALVALPGVGRWTAEYIAMRALGEPDALPTGDLVLRRMAGDLSASELDRRSEVWRPWRAYAVMLLWRVAAESGSPPRRTRHAHQADGSARARRPARRGVVAAARRTG